MAAEGGAPLSIIWKNGGPHELARMDKLATLLKVNVGAQLPSSLYPGYVVAKVLEVGQGQWKGQTVNLIFAEGKKLGKGIYFVGGYPDGSVRGVMRPLPDAIWEGNNSVWQKSWKKISTRHKPQSD